jgi:hypothetical protein
MKLFGLKPIIINPSPKKPTRGVGLSKGIKRISEGYHSYWKNITEEELKLRNEKVSKGLKIFYATLTKEQKDEIFAKRRAGRNKIPPRRKSEIHSIIAINRNKFYASDSYKTRETREFMSYTQKFPQKKKKITHAYKKVNIRTRNNNLFFEKDVPRKKTHGVITMPKKEKKEDGEN